MIGFQRGAGWWRAYLWRLNIHWYGGAIVLDYQSPAKDYYSPAIRVEWY